MLVVVPRQNYGIRNEKTSITLSPDLLAKVNLHAGKRGNRSVLIDTVLRSHFRRFERSEAEQRGLEIINCRADCLNAQAEETLEDQDIP